jgi:hypothetical protein
MFFLPATSAKRGKLKKKILQGDNLKKNYYRGIKQNSPTLQGIKTY